MKIVKLQAENFKKLKAVEIIPQGNIVEITGKCEQGKTSILDAIQALLCGQKWDKPIREGQEKSVIIGDLEDLVATRTYTKSGSVLKVTTKDGAKYPSPQKLLDGIVGKIAFNPLEFAHADSKKQVDMLLQVIDLNVDTAKLKAIAGVDVKQSNNPLDMLNTAYKAVYEDRTLVNRQLNQAKEVLAGMLNVPEVKPVSVVELVAEKERLENINQDNQKQIDLAAEQARKVKEIARDQQHLEIEVERAKKILAHAEFELDAKKAEYQIEEEKRVSLQVIANNIKDEDLTNINNRIANADKTNLQAKQYQYHQTKQAEVNKLQSDSDGYTTKLEAIKKYKSDIIKKTKFPVPGLDFANGGVIYKGQPFSQASSAEKIRVGMAIGMAGNPELRVVMIDGYESLDSTQREIVEEMAVKHDFQVWTTAVDESGTVGIYIEDGEVKNG